RSSVYFTQHDIERSNDGDDIRDHVSLDHFLQRLKIHERWRPHARSIRLSTAIADDVIAQFPFRSFDGMVDVPDGRLDDLRKLGHDRSIRNLLDRLSDDASGLTHLLDSNHVPIVSVAGLANGNIELKIRVRGVGFCFSQIPLDARAAKRRSGHSK